MKERGCREELVKPSNPVSGVLQAYVRARPVLGELNFEALADQLKVGVFINSVDGRTLYVNEAISRMSGYTASELLALPVNVHYASQDELDRFNERLVRDGRVQDFEAVAVRKDRTQYHTLLSAVVVRTETGEPEYVVGTTEDMTERLSGHAKHLTELNRAENERKAMQEQLMHAQKMESIGRLAGGIAHDFNNMLGVILGQSELCLDSLEPDSPLRVDLEEIRDAALRSVDLTRQLLAFARRQSNQPKVLDLNEIVSGTLGMMRRLIGEGVELQWRPGREVWPVYIDPSQVNQMLANLCVNARDAIKGTGTITIATENAWFDEEHALSGRRGDYAKLAVSDTGSGMNEQTAAHVFEPFFTTKDQGHGTGLGLASVYGIVTQNQGSIDVQSSPGQGTTFSIYLPRHHEDSSTEPIDETTSPGVSKGKETILLVEDEASVGSIERRMLEHLGYEVLVARTPREAISVMEQQGSRIELVIVDVVMPEMNGHELAVHLTQLRPELRVLLVSGYPADSIADYGVPNSSTYVLQKPLTVQTLSSKIREVLDAAPLLSSPGY